MLAKQIPTTWNEEVNTTSKTVKEATLIGIVIAATLIIFLPDFSMLAKMAMVPMGIAISYIAAALISAKRSEPVYELGLVGQGLGVLAVILFFAASIL